MVKKLLRRLSGWATVNNGVLAIALLIASSWMWSTVDAVQRNFKLQQQTDALQQQIALQELQNKTLQFQNAYYQTDEYLELSARERLGKAGPGEKVLLLPPNTISDKPAVTVDADQTPITQRSPYAQWMYFLFGKKS